MGKYFWQTMVEQIRKRWSMHSGAWIQSPGSSFRQQLWEMALSYFLEKNGDLTQTIR